MIISILIFLLSIVPSILIFIWLRSRHKEDALYKKTATKCLIGGFIDVLPILAVSGTLYLINNILKNIVFKEAPQLIFTATHNFIVLAFAEELVKFLTLVIILKKKKEPYSSADVIAYMVIIGTAFGLIEDVPYAIGADPITMLVRGFTMGHVSYAFITGFFYAKGLKSGKKVNIFLALFIPWLIHGLYDFSLSKELLEINDNFVFLPIIIVIIELVILIMMFVFFIKERKGKKEKYQEILECSVKEEAVEEEEN